MLHITCSIITFNLIYT